MSNRAIAALLVLAGGLVLTASAVLALLAGKVADWHDTVALVGFGIAVLGIALAGYEMVASAPVWLRIIVAVCFPLLVASLWQAVTPSLEDLVDGWRGPVVAYLVAGVLAGLAGLVGWSLSRTRTTRSH